MTESEEESDGSEETTQAGFHSRAHKLATLFIMTAGSANATRFPEMSIAHGGVPFMLAYLALLVAVAMPIMHLESSLAQFSEDGNRGIFGAVPLFIGLGYTMSLCAVMHILGDSVTLSQHLLHLVSSLRNLSWSGCPAGELVASDRTCYAAPAPLCSNVRSRLAESFRREQLDQGLPTSGGSDGALVVAVPARDYRHEAAGCIPGVYNPVHQPQP
ncbi:sodium- and chloride-dependent neutral and basic amino acid transporter B(0+)-like [Amblyomma americanum]